MLILGGVKTIFQLLEIIGQTRSAGSGGVSSCIRLRGFFAVCRCSKATDISSQVAAIACL